MIRLTVACLLGVCVWLCQADASAQVAPTPDSLGNKSKPVVRRAPLDATILLSDEGQRNIYLTLPGGWSPTRLDDFHNFLLKDLQNPLPPFILWNVSATGTIVGNYVEAQVRVELSTTGYQPVRIPLGFKNGIFPSEDQTNQPPFRHTGTGSAHLTVDPKEEQYVAVVVPQSDQTAGSENSDHSEKPEFTQQHTLTFVLWIPFSQNSGGESRLPLSFPKSLSSLFSLEIPMSNIVPSVSQGSILTAQEHPEQQSTLLKVQGLRPDTAITWEKKKIEIVDDRPVLLVKDASIDVRLNARSTVYDAILPVSSATGSFEQLKIRLPQGCILDREMADKYAVAGDYSIENMDEEANVNKESVVTVRFQQKTSGPVSIRLRAVQHFEEDKPDFKRNLAGFEVLGAERQTGFLTVSVPPLEMKPHWDPIRGVRRSEGSSSGAGASLTPLVSATGDTRFEFISQPFLLQVRVASPQTRINVKPEYRFHFSRGTIEMTARLTYTVSGSKTDVLHIHLFDDKWTYNFGQSSLVDVVDVKLDKSGLLTIPLRSPAEGTFDIELRARRSISSEEEQTHRVVLPMPKPQAIWSEPAVVTITLADHVEVLPIDASYSASSKQRTFGMTRQPRRTMPLRSDLPEFRQEPLVYRAESTDAVFVADVTYHQQKINTTMQTDVRLLEEYNQVTQTISYDVDYAPVDRLYFLMPESLESNGDIQIRLENRTLELRDTITGSRDNIPEGWKRKMVQLPEPKFQFQLTIQYSLLPFTVPADVTALCSLFFICPADVQVSDHRIHFFAPSDYQVELQDESKSLWESFREPRRPSIGATGTFRSTHSPNKIALSISVSEKNISGTTIIERAWIQTWLTGTIRHDWATYILKTANNSVMIQLPPDAIQEHRIVVRVDKQPITPNIAPTGMLIIPILPEQHNRPIEVFIEYRYTFEIPGMEISIFLPAFAKNTLIQYEFWQVILPPYKHVIACSGGWTLEHDWTWNGLFFGRVPSIRKSDIGFEPDPAIILSNPNQYLFSHLHPSGHVTLYVADRSLIVLCSSGIALLIGLMLIYVRQSRYAGSLFGLGVALIAVLFYQPPLVLLTLQAAVFGVFLALGAGYIYRIFHRQKQWIPSAFPTFDDMTLSYPTPLPSQTIHEVVVDDEFANKDDVPPLVTNTHNDMSHNGQA